MKYFIVWNETKTFGVITSDQQLAYETRKSADANCFDANGNVSRTAQTFCDEYVNDNCTIQEAYLDGWIEWNGGQCPVTGDTFVDVHFRNGFKTLDRAGSFRWKHEGNRGDIIAYRVVK